MSEENLPKAHDFEGKQEEIAQAIKDWLLTGYTHITEEDFEIIISQQYLPEPTVRVRLINGKEHHQDMKREFFHSESIEKKLRDEYGIRVRVPSTVDFGATIVPADWNPHS